MLYTSHFIKLGDIQGQFVTLLVMLTLTNDLRQYLSQSLIVKMHHVHL